MTRVCAMGRNIAAVQALLGRQLLFFYCQDKLVFSKPSSEANPTSVLITLDYFLEKVFYLLNVTDSHLL